MIARFERGAQRKGRFAHAVVATLGAALLALSAPAPTPTGKAGVVKSAAGQIEGLR
jgi:hypothetical protein